MPVIAVADVAAIMLALLAIALLYGWAQFATAITNIMPNWSIPTLGSLRGKIQSLLSDALNLTLRGLIMTFQPMIEMIIAPFLIIARVFEWAYDAVYATYSTISWTVRTLVPHAITQAETYANSAVTQLRTDAAFAISAARTYAHDLYNTAETDISNTTYNAAQALSRVNTALSNAISSVYNDARGWVDASSAYAASQLSGAVATLNHALGVSHDDAINWTNVTAKSLTGTMTTLFGQAEAYAFTTATQITGAAITDLEHDVSIAVGAVWPGVSGAIEGVIDTAGSDFADVVAALKAAAASDVGAVAGTAAGALALSLPLLKLAEDCVIPNCRNLSQFGKELQALLNLFGDLGIIEFVAEAASNPQGAADEARSVFGPMVSDARSVLHSLVGVG